MAGGAGNGSRSLVASLGLFLATTAVYVAIRKHQLLCSGKKKQSEKNDKSRHGVTAVVPSSPSLRASAMATKEQVQKLRQKHFTEKLIVSYSNTGGLMFVKVCVCVCVCVCTAGATVLSC